MTSGNECRILAGKTAIVTGAARGIGRACAERLAQDGANVVLSDVNESLGEETTEGLAAKIQEQENEVAFVHCDVTQKLDVRNLVAECVDRFGQVDTLINNAGVVHGADFLTLKESDFDKVLKVNLKGSFLVGQAVARQMVDQVENGGNAGSIINMSSVNAVFAIPNQVPYSISKGGVNQLTRVMALSLAQYGIRVNAIGPGSIETDMLASVVNDKEAMAKVMTRTPIGRLGQPEEIAAIASFLASEQSSYVTGQTIYADGGRLPLNYTVPVPKTD